MTIVSRHRREAERERDEAALRVGLAKMVLDTACVAVARDFDVTPEQAKRLVAGAVDVMRDRGS